MLWFGEHVLTSVEQDLFDTIETLQAENEQLKADCDRFKERLQISPYGDDKIDELDEALENCKFQYEQLKQENEQLRAQVVRVRETLIDYKTFLESFQCTCEPSNETYPGVYCERCYRLDQAKQVLAEIDKLSPEEVQEIVKVKADGRMVERGTWINGYCSNCNSPIPTDNKDDYIAKNECRFCYYCGAKMEEAAEKALVEGKEVE